MTTKTASAAHLNSVYDDDTYAALFAQENALTEKLPELNIRECQQRLALERMGPTMHDQSTALSRALLALDGVEHLPERDESVFEARRALTATKLQMQEINRGLPEARFRTRRRRDVLTRQRIGQPDVQAAAQRTLKAVQELVQADAAMHDLLDVLASKGFAVGRSEAMRYSLSVECDPNNADTVSALAVWAGMLEGLLCK
jgi:hypothetical protein